MKFLLKICLLPIFFLFNTISALPQSFETFKSNMDSFFWGEIENIDDRLNEVQSGQQYSSVIQLYSYNCFNPDNCIVYRRKFVANNFDIDTVNKWLYVSCQPGYTFCELKDGRYKLHTVSEEGIGISYFTFANDTLEIDTYYDGQSNGVERYVKLNGNPIE